jgi:hypothetical protein
MNMRGCRGRASSTHTNAKIINTNIIRHRQNVCATKCFETESNSVSTNTRNKMVEHSQPLRI